MEKEVLKLYIEKGMSFKDISKELSISYNTILRYAKKYDLKSNVGSQGARKHYFNEDFFEVINTEEKAYWLGFIAADGCIYKNANAWRLQINLKYSDCNHLERFQIAINSNYKIAKKNVGKSEVCQLKVNSKKLCFDLINLGITERKSLEVQFPDIPNHLVHHFIRGYFDGDGNIKNFYDKHGRHRYNFNIVGGIDMLNSINKNMPCELSIYKIKRQTEIFTLETSMKNKLISIYNFLYKDATIYLNRKKDIFDDLMSSFAEM